MLNHSSVYIIAEAGVNHNGNRDLALRLVDAAAQAGVNAVKFQTFKADKLVSKTLKKAQYQENNTGCSESQYEMLVRLEMPESWHDELQEHANSQGIEFLSTAFDISSLALLTRLNLPRYKIGSGELVNAPLLWQFSKTNKPLILSTGMAVLSEIEQALAVIAHGLSCDKEPKNWDEIWTSWNAPTARNLVKERVTLLHCTSQYPTPWHEVNLKAMDTLKSAFGLPVGYSDHTLGIMMPVAAVARGAVMIEKHFTLDRTLQGPDHCASIEVEELKTLVTQIRHLEMALGDGMKVPQPSEWDTRKLARQSIVAAKNLSPGHIIQRPDLTTSRTGGGVAPHKLWEMIGQPCIRSYEAGELIIQ